jgi:hypothetical protein
MKTICALVASALMASALVDAAPMRRQGLGMDDVAQPAAQPTTVAAQQPMPTASANAAAVASPVVSAGAQPNNIKACQIQIINKSTNTVLSVQSGEGTDALQPLAVGQTTTYTSGDSAFATMQLATVANLPTASHPEGAGSNTRFYFEFKNDWMSTPWVNWSFMSDGSDGLPTYAGNSKISLSEGECGDVQVSGSAFKQARFCRQGDSDYKVLTVEIYSQ